MKLNETFEEWEDKDFCFDEGQVILARIAWDHQQKKIDKLLGVDEKDEEKEHDNFLDHNYIV